MPAVNLIHLALDPRKMNRNDFETWQQLSGDFAKLANEEKSANALPLGAMAVPEANPLGDVSEWVIHNGHSENLRAQFELLASQGGIALGPMPRGATPLRYWLHRLYQHLHENRSNLSRFFISSDIEAPVIDAVCEASTTLCLRLQKRALDPDQQMSDVSARYNDWIVRNHVSVSIPAQVSERNSVSLVAENANTTIPIEFLSSRLQEIRSIRGSTVFGSPVEFLNGMARTHGLIWAITQRGLWMAQQAPCAGPYIDANGVLHGKHLVGGDLNVASSSNGKALDDQFAQMAVEEARKSRAEDGREHPRVGCVVVRNGKILAAAYRGEVTGNHAEFVALEAKLKDETLAGCTVYTTLEPCTTRNHPKIPCADRLIERKVARVVIGTLDPNPKIRGLGMWKLQQANIAVEMFPHQLAMELSELNRQFFRSFAGPSIAAMRKPAEPVPNVCSLRPEIATISYDAECDVWSRGNAGATILAVVLPFVNEPRPPLLTAGVDALRARLNYYEDGSVEPFARIDSGCWLNDAYRFRELRVGDIAYLVAAVRNDDVTAAILNPRYSIARYSEDHTEAIPLPSGSYEVKVDLFGGEHGEYVESYWYKLEVGQQLKATRINQRLASP